MSICVHLWTKSVAVLGDLGVMAAIPVAEAKTKTKTKTTARGRIKVKAAKKQSTARRKK